MRACCELIASLPACVRVRVEHHAAPINQVIGILHRCRRNGVHDTANAHPIDEHAWYLPSAVRRYMEFWNSSFAFYLKSVGGSAVDPTAGNRTALEADINVLAFPDGSCVSFV